VSTPAADSTPPRPARSVYQRAALACLVIVLCTTGAVATAALLEVKDDVQKALPPSSQLPAAVKNELDAVDPGGPQTLLLLGSDQRYIDRINKSPTRSDTMILVRLDPSKGATAIMSIPRDLKVKIPGHGTDKINAAYALGGPALTLRTIRGLLSQGSPDGHFPINHTVNINFGGFRRAVDRLGCVYVDVDRRYFNDNNPPNGGGGDYATIDVKSGYQRLCGQDALDYVRYRHFDSDLVRAARQQDFLRQAKDQVGLGKLFSDRKALLKIFGRYTQTDIHGTTAVLRLIKLMVESAKNPIREVHFEAVQVGDYLQITPEHLRRDVGRVLNAKTTSGERGKARKTAGDRRLERKQRKRSRKQSVPAGLVDVRGATGDLGVQLGVKVPFPVYYPRFAAIGSVLKPLDSRAYDLYDRGHNKYRAYRMVFSAPGIGQYYGVQGTSWRDPPLLDSPSETRTVDGRKLELFFDGSRLRVVAWRSPRAVYWVSNTLLLSLKNKQMLAIARSLRRVGT
jgi:LCP family protein required for cell wall assembly